MRVGIVTEWFERGAAYVSKQFADQLSEAGFDVFIYARNEHGQLGAEAWESENLTVGSPIKMPFAKPLHRSDFRSWIKENNIELVLFNEQIWLPPVIWARELGAKTVGYVDYYTKESVKNFALYDGLICNTKRHKSVFDWHEGMIYIPWGTKTDLFLPRERPETRPLTFFHSAGWSPYRKGTDLAIVAFAKHIEETKSVSRLVVHSQVDISLEFPHLASKIEYMTSTGNLEIIAETVGAPGLYHLGDVYLYPSRLDGIGLTLAEALSCGLSLVTTDEGPMSEFALGSPDLTVPASVRYPRGDGYYWEMVEVSTDALAEALFQVEQQKLKPFERAQLSRTTALNHFDWAKNATNLTASLQSLDRREVPSRIVSAVMRREFGTLPRYIFMKLFRTPVIWLVKLGQQWRKPGP